MTAPTLQQHMREALAAGIGATGMSPEDLWVGYLAVGGSQLPAYVDEVLTGRRPLVPDQYDLLAQAVNDRSVHLGQPPSMPYFSDIDVGT